MRIEPREIKPTTPTAVFVVQLATLLARELVKSSGKAVSPHPKVELEIGRTQSQETFDSSLQSNLKLKNADIFIITTSSKLSTLLATIRKGRDILNTGPTVLNCISRFRTLKRLWDI